MAFNLKPVFGYTVVYVKNVAKSVDFCAKASGYNVRRLDEFHRWGELESGQTTIAFTPKHQHETDKLTGAVQDPRSDREDPQWNSASFTRTSILLTSERRRCARLRTRNGDKEWGQRVGYVRDIDGITEDGKPCLPTKTSLI